MFTFDSQIFSNMIQLYLTADAMTDAWETLKELVEHQAKLQGVPNVEPLVAFAEKACERGEVNRALVTVKIMRFHHFQYLNLN